MTWSIEWSAPAIETLRGIPWHQAERVDAAVMRFAASGEGDRFRLEGDDPLTFRLRVRPYVARMSLEPRPRIIRVWYVYRQPGL